MMDLSQALHGTAGLIGKSVRMEAEAGDFRPLPGDTPVGEAAVAMFRTPSPSTAKIRMRTPSPVRRGRRVLAG